MRLLLLRLLLLACLQALSQASYGQTPMPGEPPIIIPDPIYLLNSTTVINGAFGRISPNDIDKIMIYKRGSTAPEPMRNLTSTGIIDIALKKSSKFIKRNTFKQVARQQKVRGPFRVALNGQLLSAAQATTLRIAPAAIGQVQVMPSTADDPAALLSITLAREKPIQRPPGTIMIRGVAVQ